MKAKQKKNLIAAAKKDPLLIFLAAIVIFVVAYLTIWLTALLTKLIVPGEIWISPKIVMAIFMDTDKRKALLCVAALEAAGVIYMSMNKPVYRSPMVEITPDIHIPAPAGQYQCGSAWFLDESRFETAFGCELLPTEVTRYPELISQFHLSEAGFVLGKKDTRKGEQIYFIREDTHAILLGATRSGKTRCSILETIGFLPLAGESMIITDVKGELYDYTRPYLEQLGYDVKCLNWAEPPYSDGWNYLQPVIDYVDADMLPEAIDATWDVVSQLVGEAKGEKIWNDGECSMIAASIMAVVWDNRTGENRRYRNFANVYYFLVNMCTPVTSGKNLIVPLDIYIASLPEQHPAKGLLGVSNVAPSRTKGSFYTSALMTLRLFTNPYVAHMSSHSDFSPKALGMNKMAVFLILPDDRMTYHSLATLFCSQAYSLLSKTADQYGGRLPNRVNGVYDEFGNFTKMTNFEQQLTVGGGKGIRLFLSIQDFAQLEQKYEKVGQRIISSNAETWVYLKSDDVETLKVLVEKMDKYTTTSYSTSTNSNSTSSKVTSTGASQQLIGRELLTVSEVQRIKRPYSLVLSRNDPAIMYAPDLSQWSFNHLFGMGDPRHNIALRKERQQHRVKKDMTDEIPLWGIWNVIISMIKKKAKENAAKELLEKMEGEIEEVSQS